MAMLSRIVETYDFYRGTRHWRVTGGQRPVVLETQTYSVLRGLQRKRIADSIEEGRNALEITVPGNFALLDLFRPFPPMARIHVNFKRVRVSDGGIESAWMGVVATVDDAHPSWSTIRCQSLASAMASGRGGVWQVPCWKALYSAHPRYGCNVEPDAFREDGTLIDVIGTTITSPSLALHGDGWFDGGVVTWVDSSGDRDYCFIVKQVGSAATLLTPMRLPAGSAVSFLPGCDHALTTCDAKFHNAINYGGVHTMPDKNAFGEAVF